FFQSNPLVDLGGFARNSLPPSTLWIVPATGGEPRQLTQAGSPAGGHGSPAWSPDGHRIAFEVDEFNAASVWSVSIDGKDLKPVTPEGNSLIRGQAPSYAPDVKSIFYHNGAIFQRHIDPKTGAIIGDPVEMGGIVQPPYAIRRISFSADGKRMAFGTLRRAESISSVALILNSGEAAGTPYAVISNATGRNNFPAFSPDGKRLAYSTCSIGGSACDIWIANPDGTNQTQLTTSEKNELSP